MFRMTRWDIGSASCTLVAFTLTLLGTIFPYWWVVREHDADGAEWTFHYGIWIIIGCHPDSCVTESSGMKDDRAWLLGPAVLLIFAITVLLVSTVCNVLVLFTNRYNKTLRRLAIVCCCGAGATVILAVLIFYKKKAGLRPSAAPETTDGSAEWALFLATSGGLVAICASVVMGVGFKRRKLYKRQRKDSVFGMKRTAEFEIDVNALRKGVLIQGTNVNKVNLEKGKVSEMAKPETTLSPGKFSVIP